MTTVADVEQALGRVTSPCALGMGHDLDFVTMGKVEHIEVEPERVTIRLIDDPMCFFVRSCQQAIKDRVLELPDVHDVHFEFSATTLWTPDLMRRPDPRP